MAEREREEVKRISVGVSAGMPERRTCRQRERRKSRGGPHNIDWYYAVIVELVPEKREAVERLISAMQ